VAYLGDISRSKVVYAVNSMWNAPDRHLDPVPGVEKAGCGRWGYAGGDAVLRDSSRMAGDTGGVPGLTPPVNDRAGATR